MALQLGALRAALLEAGASEERANRAAEELAGYEDRFTKLETDHAVMKWMLGANIGLTLIILGKLFI